MSASSALACRAARSVQPWSGEVAVGSEMEVEAALGGVRNSGDVVQRGMGIPVPIELVRRPRQEGGAAGPVVAPLFRLFSSARRRGIRRENTGAAP
jgi:hypothetical protein